MLDDNVPACCAVPEITGATVHCGATAWGGAGAAETRPVGLETAVAEPFLFDAFTETRIVEPTSAEANAYVWLVAPATGTQLAPAESHRCHA